METSDEEFEVHIYSNVTHSPGYILELGQDAIRDSCAVDGWIQPLSRSYAGLDDGRLGRWYEYALTPPVVLRKTGRCERELKPWGAPVSADEIFCLEELEEFEVLSVSGGMEDGYGDLRRTLDPHHAHLPVLWDELLPQPHTYPLPTPSKKPHRDLKSTIRPFDLSTAYILAPHAEFILQNPYSVVGWIVPVHGSVGSIFGEMEMEGGFVSGARVVRLDRSDLVFVSKSNSKSKSRYNPSTKTHPQNTITWTRSTLRSFWTFLITVRARHRFGPLSLHYVVHHGVRVRDPVRVRDGVAHTKNENESAYIKIGCRGDVAFYVRRLLDSWFFVPSDDDDEEEDGGGKEKRVRLLRGMKLVLVDDVGVPCLVA